MTDILIRDLSPTTVARLKQSARKHGRSLQAHLKLLLEEVAPFTMAEAAAASRAWHQRLKGRRFADSATLLREDRAR
jgi:plasmid stability protein